MNNNRLLTTIFATGLLSLSACSDKANSPLTTNNPNSNDPTTQTITSKKGTFSNGAISGVQYKTTSKSGVIGDNGEFSYIPGENVSFYIGDILLGETQAKDNISILDLTPQEDSTESPEIVNRLRLLYSLDDDGDPFNGIQISIDVRNNAANITINFDQETEEFENDIDINILVSSDSTPTLVSDTTAIVNYNEIEPTSSHLDLDLAKKSGCFACHSVDTKVVGPAWIDVAQRYRYDPDAMDKLVQKVKDGGKGNWTEITNGAPMPAYSPRVTDENIEKLVHGILTLSTADLSVTQTAPTPNTGDDTTNDDNSDETKFEIPTELTVDVLDINLGKRSGCFACHSVGKPVIGPSWFDVAERYRDDVEARIKLFEKVQSGGKGNWTDLTGGIPMPPYSPRVSDENILKLVDGILQLTEDDLTETEFKNNPIDHSKHGHGDVGIDDEIDDLADEDIDDESNTEMHEVVTETQLLSIAKKSGCLACHSIERVIVGPKWLDVANRYRDDADALEYLVEKVKKGGKGNWAEVTGDVPMPPYSPRVNAEDIRTLVKGILVLEDDSVSDSTTETNVTAEIDINSGDYQCVKLETTKGQIKLALDVINAPNTANNFIAYLNEGFYNGTLFHRVIENFMIQGGGFTSGLVKKSAGSPIANEADNGLKNIRGSIAAARTSDPHSATSQFFINTSDNDYLDYTRATARGWGYAVFGQVIIGMDVVDAISKLKTGAAGPFSKDVPVESVTIDEMALVNCDTLN